MKAKTAWIVAGAAGVLALLIVAEQKAAAAASAVGGAIVSGAQAVNPLNNNNVFATGVNDLGASITGNSSFDLGAWLWEALHPGQVAAENAALASPVAPAQAPNPTSPTPDPAAAVYSNTLLGM